MPAQPQRTTRTTRTKLHAFKDWIIDDIKEVFELQAVEDHALLAAWMKAEYSGSDAEQEHIRLHQRNLRRNVTLWNEEELKLKFIAHILSLVGYDTERYRGFAERRLQATVRGVPIGGMVDYMVATGEAVPKQPFFFLHEYKRERGRDNDPLAQLLAEMLAARELNASPMTSLPHPPLYGCYVVGRNWFFVVLADNEYSESNAFNAADDDLFHIIAILRAVKRSIDEWLGG